MANISDALFLVHIPAVARVSNRPTRMIQQWLGSGTFVPRADPEKMELILEQIDWEGLVEAIASDVDRLSKAGRETLQVMGAVTGMPKASAWMLIQCYYASFYFSQAVLRTCGIIPSYFAGNELNNLKNILRVYGVTSPFALKGQLLITVDGASKTISIRKGDGGASHEATWHELSALLTKTRELLPRSILSEEEKAEVSDDIAKFRIAIASAGGSQAKLSTIRNNVQYRQELGGWYPYVESIKSDDIKRRVASTLAIRTSLSQFELSHHMASIRFVESCLLVCFSGRLFLKNLEKTYGSGFLRQGFCKLDNQYAAQTTII